MPAPLAVYLTSVTFLWICALVSSDEQAQYPHDANHTAEADLRSMGGRVPPYHPPMGGIGPPVQNIGINRQNSRIKTWPDNGHYGLIDHIADLNHDMDMGNDDVGDDCAKQCTNDEFFCQISCECISIKKRCDGVNDCPAFEDEEGCSPCDENKNRTICASSSVCILLDWICDGDNDCDDFSDETSCGVVKNCTADQYQCSNKLCIHKTWVCDGQNDCHDNSDEHNCTKGLCRDNQFTCATGDCINAHWRCDKEPDCRDSSDEADCPIDLLRCGENEFQCDNKKCIRKEFHCDGDNDCGDWTDEATCPMIPGSCNAGEFKCSDGKCIPERWRCDIEQDCLDGGDELNCEPHMKRNCSADEFSCHDKRCILKTWLCDGVRDCTTGEDEHNCQIFCEEDQYMCKMEHHDNVFRNCVNRKHVCDGMRDCPKGDDEEKCPVKRNCGKDDKCEKICITTHDERSACMCPVGFLLGDDGYSCRDIDECLYEQDPVCSQTCSNTVGSFICGCMTGYVLRPDGRSCKPTGNSTTLLFSNRVGIRQVSLNGDNYTPLIKGLHNAVALDYHFEKQLVFWSENNLRVIRVAQINTNNISDVIRWGLETPGGVAVDWIHNLLFWTDSGTRRVEVASLDGSLRSVIAANEMDKPRAIAVHPGDAFVFWTDWGPIPKIERADMDGQRRRSIIVDGIFWPNGLTIDYTESRIYWVDAKHHVIQKSTFDGLERKTVTNKGLPHPFAITIFEDAVFWTDWHTKSISTVNKNTGMGIQTIHAGSNVPMDIHSYHPLRQLKTYRNRCGHNNGGCSHLCLPNSNSYTCRCPVGFNIDSDGRSCEETPENLLLYARKKDLRLKQLNPKKQVDSLDMVIPVENVKHAVALDWDHNSNSIFWTDVEKDTINRAFLNGSHQTVVVGSNLISPAGLAYDWITNKLYWTDAGTNRIEVANANGSMRTLLAWERIDKPRDIVLDPKGGVMYWSDWGSKPCIEKADMDGGNRRRIIFGDMTWPNGLALDFSTNRIYWADGGNRTIEYANFDGTGRTSLISTALPHPFGLDLFGDEIFWTDWDTQSIQAANKYTGKNRRTLGSGVAGLMDVRVFHTDRRGGYNKCSKNNGGCSHLCLLRPGGVSCACPIGIKLNNDNRTCSDGPINYLIFAHRVDIRIISLDVPYLIDVVLPLKTLKNALGVDVDRKTGIIYWTDTGERKISRSTKGGRNQEAIISKGLHTADGIAIDSSGRKIYWTDGGRNSIEVAELDGSNRKVLIWTGLDSPRAITLHYNNANMFWSDWGTSAKIERADMDGNNRKCLVDRDIKWPNGLAIDKLEDRLYWNDAKLLKIESSDFEGKDRKTILSNVPYPYGLVIVGRYIYWTDWKNESLQRADKTTGKHQTVIRENLQGLMDIKAVQNEAIIENACGKNNGGCSHLCLRSSKPPGYTCACPTGITFENATELNPKICRNYPESFLVFATRGSVAMISLDTPEQWDVTFPIKNVGNSIAVDFHWDNKLIFFTDVNNDIIRSVNMLNMSETKVIVNTKLDTPNGLGVDWIANNLYWTDNDFKVIEVARLDGSSRKTLVTGLSEPRALALFPAKGYLYWSDWGEKANIERSYLDGSKRKTIVDQGLKFPNGITIDYKDRRLYWTDAFLNRIDRADLDGNHRVQFIPEAKNPFGMTQFNDFIYWTNWNEKSVMRADKISGENITTIRSDLEMAMEIKAVASNKQHGWNPCREDNGGCSHLCLFRAHDYVCECPDEADDKPCIREPYVRVDSKMPSHYPHFYEYSDVEEARGAAPEAPPRAAGAALAALAAAAAVAAVAAAAAFYCLKLRKERAGVERKESFREVGGHISFHNPNYNNGAPAGEHERRNRFQGIFKYEKNQERVTNVYIPEGASLLPGPAPSCSAPSPPPAPPRPAPLSRPYVYDNNFEAVILDNLSHSGVHRQG